MRLASFLAPLAALGVAACTGPSAGLEGSWRTAPIPSGAGVGMSLTTAGSVVTGTGQAEGLVRDPIHSVTIAGRREPNGTFRLTLTYDDGTVATYSGQMVGSGELEGTWSAVGQSPYALTFWRQQH